MEEQGFSEMRDSNYELVSNRIAYYYKEVFNIEIEALLCKKNTSKILEEEIKNQKANNSEEVTFKFYVLIKDNNKKFCKHRLIKCKFNLLEYLENQKKNDFIDYLYYCADEKIGYYCKKKYLNEKNKNFNKIYDKNMEINEDYQKWKIEKYGKTEENFEQNQK